MTRKISPSLHWQHKQYYESFKNPEDIYNHLFHHLSHKCQACLSICHSQLVIGCCDPSVYMPHASCLTDTNLRAQYLKISMHEFRGISHWYICTYVFKDLFFSKCCKSNVPNVADPQNRPLLKLVMPWEHFVVPSNKVDLLLRRQNY